MLEKRNIDECKAAAGSAGGAAMVDDVVDGAVAAMSSPASRPRAGVCGRAARDPRGDADLGPLPEPDMGFERIA